MATTAAKLEKSGRILIPAAIRRELNLTEGSEILIRVDERGLMLSTREGALERIRQRLREVIPPNRILSDELIHERRAEADRETAR